MLKLGQTNVLDVVKKESHGYYLDGGENWGTILLPNKVCPENIQVGSQISAFIYFDSEDTIIATTKKPFAQVGDFCSLKVIDKNDIGVFLDWGLDKDLFVPHREQIFDMEVGKKYVVYTYIDSSQRIAATTRINKHTHTVQNNLDNGQAVKLLTYQKTPLGFNAIINNKYSGLLFNDDIVNHVHIGQNLDGYIKNIRPDGKIDLSLSSLNNESLSELSNRIVEQLKQSNGVLNFSAKSSAEIINKEFGVSRKKFKIAIGHLYKKRIIDTDNNSISLLK